MLELEPTPRLYIVTMEGCPSCAEAKPAIDKLRFEHATEILVVDLHLDRYDWDILGWRPQETPGYALVVDGKIVRKATGAMSFRQLTDWLAGKEPRAPKRRRRRAAQPVPVPADAGDSEDVDDAPTDDEAE